MKLFFPTYSCHWRNGFTTIVPPSIPLFYASPHTPQYRCGQKPDDDDVRPSLFPRQSDFMSHLTSPFSPFLCLSRF